MEKKSSKSKSTKDKHNNKLVLKESKTKKKSSGKRETLLNSERRESKKKEETPEKRPGHGGVRPTRSMSLARFTSPAKRVPATPKTRPFFGKPSRDGGCALDAQVFVQKCLTWLEADTSRLKETGLYRISGGLSSIHKLKEAAEKDATTFVIPPSEDTHSVTGVLKLYLREMTDPLVPFDLYSSFIAAASLEEGKDEKIQTAVSTLPPGNKLIFDKLFYHLNKVTTHSLENKMDSKNLAVVFAPTILRPPNDDLETVFGDAVFSNELVSGLIERPDYFIPLTSDNEFPLHTDTQDPAPVPPTPLHDSPSKTLPHTHSMPSTIVPPSPSSSSKKSKSKSKLMISSKKLNYTTKEDNHNMEKEGKE